MSGFDNGSLFGGISQQVKQHGSILRGFGPPVPQAGVVGDLYIDVLSWQLFEKRSPDSGGDVDPWGHYLFVVPALYRNSLKWFGETAPTNDLGVVGDYYMLWGGYPNYGMQPAIFGPKQWSGWPSNGDGPGTVIATGYATVGQLGLLAEGASLTDKQLNQLIAAGLTGEFVIPVAVTANELDPVGQLGLTSGPSLVAVTLNSLYTAEDGHSI
jgi:hypothetical protein